MAVYFAQAGESGPVKIGWCKDSPKKRVADLQTGCPVKLNILYVVTRCARNFEGNLHELFSKHRIRGEWFTYCKEIQEFISRHYNAEEAREFRLRIREQDRLEKEHEEEEEREQEQYEEEQYEKYMRESEEAYEQELEERSLNACESS